MRTTVNSCPRLFIRSAKEPLTAHWLHCGSIETWQRRESRPWLIASRVVQSAPPILPLFFLSIHPLRHRSAPQVAAKFCPGRKIWTPPTEQWSNPLFPAAIRSPLAAARLSLTLSIVNRLGSGYALLLSPSDQPGSSLRALGSGRQKKNRPRDAVRECFLSFFPPYTFTKKEKKNTNLQIKCQGCPHHLALSCKYSSWFTTFFELPSARDRIGESVM